MKKNLFFLAILILFGCNSKPENSYIRPPILDRNAQAQVIQLLDINNPCKLPCFLAITPGDTKWSNTEDFLGQLNEIRPASKSYKDGNTKTYMIDLGIVEENAYLQFPIGVAVENDTVQRIDLSTSGFGSSELLVKYWKKYSLREIYNQLGMPDKIFIDTCPKYAPECFSILSLYFGKKIVLNLSGNNVKKQVICPVLGQVDQIKEMEISISNPSNALEIFPPDWTAYSATEFWHPIYEILGINERQFYERILSETPACFKVISPE